MENISSMLRQLDHIRNSYKVLETKGASSQVMWSKAFEVANMLKFNIFLEFLYANVIKCTITSFIE